MKRWSAKLAALLLLAVSLPAFAQDLASFEKQVTVKTLPNGLTVVLYRRPEAPVFSFFTLVDAGSAQDPLHKTGLAHMMEHMAFKGTPDIGTTDYAKEKVALQKVEETYAAYEAERVKRVGQDPQKLKQLQEAWQAAIKDADQYVIKNQFGEIVESHGGVGLNAFTSYDETGYMYSLPSNQFELWAALESDRFKDPVMREFYKERNVVMEERRMRTDSRPTGRLVEQFLGTAFMANPYHRPTIGYASDLQSFSATDAHEFFHHNYVPSNMVIGLVGDLDPAKVMPIIEEYFGQLPTAPKPQELTTTEPPQNSLREVNLQDPSQPFYLEGYHRPSYLDPDDAVYDAITDIMSNGRVSRLYRALVRDQKIAAYAAGFSGLPGTKYAHLFAFYGVPAPRPHQRRAARRDPQADRPAEDDRHHRRRAGDVQDALQGRPHPQPGQQRRAGAGAGHLPDALWRLARVVSLSRSRRQGDQGRCSPRRQPGFHGDQPHHRRNPDRPAAAAPKACLSAPHPPSRRLAERSAIMRTRRMHRLLWLCCFALLAVSLCARPR